MTSVEDRSVAEVELSTRKKNAQNEQKRVYSREFLLSSARLDVSWRLPEGCDKSILSELYEAHDGLLEPFKGSGILYLPKCSSSGCSIQSTIPQSHCNAYADRKTVGHSTWLNKDRNSSEIHDPDTERHGESTKTSFNVAECKAGVMGKNSTDSEKTGICLLSKSKNPYRPPHVYKVGITGTTFEAESNAEQNTKVNTIRNDDKQEMDQTSEKVTPSCHASNFQASLKEEKVTTCRGLSSGEPTSHSEAAPEEKVAYSDSEKLNLSIYMDKCNEEQERSSQFLTESNTFSSCSIEKALPQSLGSTENPEVEQTNKPTADAYMDNRHCETKLYCSLTSKPYEFLIPIGYDYFESVLSENTATWITPTGINTADACRNLGTCVLDEDQPNFDGLWSDISAVTRFDQLMEQYQTADFGIQEDGLVSVEDIRLPEEDNLITVEDIRLPEEDSLTTVEDIRLPEEDSLTTVEDIRWPDEESFITAEDMLQPNISHFTESNLKADESRIDGDLHYTHASLPVQTYFLIETPILLSTYQYPGLDQYCCTNMTQQPARFKANSKSKGHSRLFQTSMSQQPTIHSLPNQHLIRYGGAHTDIVKELMF